MSTSFHFALLVLRIAAGLMIATHGYAHIWKKGKLTIAGTAGWFGSMGMRPPLVQAWLASITEIGSGVLLTVGLFTPLAAAGLFGVMVVAFLIAHRTNGFFIYNEGQGWEYVAIVMAVALSIGTVGPGQWSLDELFGITLWGLTNGVQGTWRGMLTVLFAGGGGALLLLATCWRPAKASKG
jgi:putative oxidoreductase